MNRNTILAIVLSVLVIIGFSILNSILFPPKPKENATWNRTESPSTERTPESVMPTSPQQSARDATGQNISTIQPVSEVFPEKTVTLKNELVEADFSTRGARLISFRLLNHLDKGEPVDMVNLDFGGRGSFELAWGDLQAPVIDEVFQLMESTSDNLAFAMTYTDLNGKPFKLIKRYKLFSGEYMLQVEVIIQSLEGNVPVIPGQEKGLTLILGPQMGPKFDVLDNQKEFRRYYAFANENLEEIKINQAVETRTTPLVWAGIAGKYFALAGIPGTPGLSTVWSNKPMEGLANPSILGFSSGRPMTPLSNYIVKVYMGPKQQQVLEKYGSLQLTRIIDRNTWLGWLEDIMKAGLNLSYLVIPNYGIGIIIITILLRLILLPLTISSQKSMAAMASLQPKVQAIQEKYKNDTAKLNEEIAKLYQKERINPLGGCLPMLLQLPLFFAFYGLLSSHFDLRGAMFIPGWIEDLSLPDTILSFGGWRVPILNWTDLRLLPIIMLLSQFFMSWVTPGQGTSGMQGKIFQIGLPVFFFFILYEFPSGLVLYWTVTNIISAASQYYFNTHLKKKPAN